MVYCSICRHDVEYEQHWGSRYRMATVCKFCKSEEELEFLPAIIGRICEIEYQMKMGLNRFSNLSSVDFIADTLTCTYYNTERTAWLCISDAIKTKSEYFFWNQFIAGNYLETPGYVSVHEFEIIKQYFVENMPCFLSKENVNLTQATEMFNNITM